MVSKSSKYILKATILTAPFLFFISSGALFSRQPEIGSPVVGGVPQDIEDNFIPQPEEYEVSTWVEGLEIPWSPKGPAGSGLFKKENYGRSPIK